MLKKQLLFLVFILYAYKLNAQNIILVANGGGLYSLDIGSGNCVITEINTPACKGEPFSAALFKDTLYYSGFDKATSAYTIFQTVLGNSSYCKKFRITSTTNNLTVDSAGIIYWVDSDPTKSFWSLDPHSGIVTYHGHIYFDPSGDLIFYKSKLYMAANGGILVEVDIQTPENSKQFMITDQHLFYGLINIPVGCNKNQVFGVESENAGSSTLIEIDMENKKIGNTYCTIPLNIFDAASITETGIVKGVSVASVKTNPDCNINGNSGSIDLNVLSASPGNINIFLNGKSTDNTGFFKNLAAGNYNFHIVSADGCIADTTIQVEKSAKLDLSIKALPDTCNAQKGAITVKPLGNYGLLTYYLNNEIQSSNNFNNLIAGAYKLSIWDTNQCKIDSTVTVQNTVLPFPVSSVDVKPATCKQLSGEISIYTNAAMPVKYSLNNATPQTSGLFTGLNAGNYRLHITESYCGFDTNITVTQQQPVVPNMSFTAIAPDCYDRINGSLKINVTNAAMPVSVSVDNQPSAANNIFSNLNTGLHTIKITDANSCEWDTSATVPPYISLKPQVNYSIKNPQCGQSSSGSITTSITGAESPYSFSINNNRSLSGATIINLLPGNYVMNIFNKNNCQVDSLQISLTAESNGYSCDTMYVPSAFTPNNDGLNDVLKPIIANFPTNIMFRIFNRFGETVFIATNINESWNGMYKSLPQPSGTYVWTCSYTTLSGEKKFAKGIVVLIR